MVKLPSWKEMVTLEEELAELMKRDWKVSEKDMRMARIDLEKFFEVMRSSGERITGKPFTSTSEKIWTIRRAADRKIYLTVMWFRAREIIATIVVAAIIFFWLSATDVAAGILFATMSAPLTYFASRIMRPLWSYRLYHGWMMYQEDCLSDAFYGEIHPLTVEESEVRPKPAWITRFID
ncbi:MAG: hypothetical protein PHH21_00335 [Candidatus Pacebacteria bacterium]|nr:hypothetical protein [Candidatus Paceibacterota bacterium]